MGCKMNREIKELYGFIFAPQTGEKKDSQNKLNLSTRFIDMKKASLSFGV